MRFTVALEPQPEGGFLAQCIEPPGAIMQGETEEESLENIQEAIRLVLEARRDQAVQRHARIRAVAVMSKLPRDVSPPRMVALLYADQHVAVPRHGLLKTGMVGAILRQIRLIDNIDDE